MSWSLCLLDIGYLPRRANVWTALWAVSAYAYAVLNRIWNRSKNGMRKGNPFADPVEGQSEIYVVRQSLC